MTSDELLGHIRKQTHGRITLKTLFRELRIRGTERIAVENELDRLVARGELIESRAGHYEAPTAGKGQIVGRIVVHRDGYGFLVPDNPIPGVMGDIYLSRDAIRGAMQGDRAIVRITFRGREGRAEGEVVQVVKRAHPSLTGEFRITRRGMFVAPFDQRLRDWVEIPAGMERPEQGGQVDRIGAAPVSIAGPHDLEGMIVTAEILDYGKGDSHPVGRIVEVLGRPGDFGIDVEIIIRKHQLPHRFPAAVVEEARQVAETIAPGDLRGRRDFRGLPVVTIDGETARDFDDAVLVERLSNGNYALQVHIADVSHYVKPGSAIDVEAQMRGTSVYFPDRAVPMLPFELSTNICSLKPGVDRLVLSALIEFDPKGEPLSFEFCRGVIRSVERMTYTNVHRLLEGDRAIREVYAALVDRFELMRELAEILMRRRDRRGSIDFDLPEPQIEFSPEGEMIGVTRSERTIANRLIEEFMLAANEAVAAHLEATGHTSIYRVHDPPDPKRVMEFEDLAAQFGYSLGVGHVPATRIRYHEKKSQGRTAYKDVMLPGEVAVPSKAYQKLVERIEGKPEERILSYLMLRSLKQARYSESNTGHFALAASHYTHFTSPIRRYPDLIVHRLLKAALDGGMYSNEGELRSIAEDCSFTERRAAEAERELIEWKKARFMESQVGAEFDGLIISTAKYGAFVELAQWFVEGLVPIESLQGDRFAYHENVRKIIGQRTRRTYSIGDRVRVLLDRVDPLERKLQFSIAEPVKARVAKRQEKKGGKKGGKKGRR